MAKRILAPGYPHCRKWHYAISSPYGNAVWACLIRLEFESNFVVPLSDDLSQHVL